MAANESSGSSSGWIIGLAGVALVVALLVAFGVFDPKGDEPAEPAAAAQQGADAAELAARPSAPGRAPAAEPVPDAGTAAADGAPDEALAAREPKRFDAGSEFAPPPGEPPPDWLLRDIAAGATPNIPPEIRAQFENAGRVTGTPQQIEETRANANPEIPKEVLAELEAAATREIPAEIRAQFENPYPEISPEELEMLYQNGRTAPTP